MPTSLVLHEPVPRLVVPVRCVEFSPQMTWSGPASAKILLVSTSSTTVSRSTQLPLVAVQTNSYKVFPDKSVTVESGLLGSVIVEEEPLACIHSPVPRGGTFPLN